MKKIIVNILMAFLIARTKWRANLPHFRKAVKRAERRAQPTNGTKGKRQYVYFIGGKYRVFSRKDIQYLKMRGIFRPEMNVEKMGKICLYDTLSHSNTHPSYSHIQIKH